MSIFRMISPARPAGSGLSVAEIKQRQAKLYSELTSLAHKVPKGTWTEDHWLQLRQLASDYLDHTTPMRRFPVPPPAGCGSTAASAFVECILRDEYEGLAATAVDCMRFRAVDAALQALQFFPHVRPSLHLRGAFSTVWQLLPIYRGRANDVSAALRLILPPYNGPTPLTLYRGQTRADHEAKIYRCSWTTKPATAWRYATYHLELGLTVPTVILEAVAPRDAIICAFYDRSAEVVVDPSKLVDLRLKESLG
jgi:hypothetical protein